MDLKPQQLEMSELKKNLASGRAFSHEHIFPWAKARETTVQNTNLFEFFAFFSFRFLSKFSAHLWKQHRSCFSFGMERDVSVLFSWTGFG